MDRSKIVEAILAEYRKFGPRNQEHVLIEAIKRINSDTSLLAFAMDLGIDTDAVLAPGLNEALAVEQQLIAKNGEVRS